MGDGVKTKEQLEEDGGERVDASIVNECVRLGQLDYFPAAASS